MLHLAGQERKGNFDHDRPSVHPLVRHTAAVLGPPFTQPLPKEPLRREMPAMTLLIVDDEQVVRDMCTEVGKQLAMKTLAVATAAEATELLEYAPVDILLTDLHLPGASGLALLKRVHDVYPDVARMVLTQDGTVGSAVEVRRLGAVEYVAKPFLIEELKSRLERAARSVELQRENRLLREQLRTRPGFGGLIGLSPKMENVYKVIGKVSQHDYPVLILGESGTGKELVARSVHFSSPRKERPFVPVDCSSLTPTLIESELFGHVKGAFTGALQAKQGLLESADGGTLFLDEIGDMPTDMQAKLLRALQEHEIKPVGSTERRSFNVRIIAATNRDLEAAIRGGAFRQDLYFRLNVVQVKLPPLRDRKNDIPLLVTSFLEKLTSPDARPRTISEDAMRRMIAYDWPVTCASWKTLWPAPWRWVPVPPCKSATCHRACIIRSANALRKTTNSCRSKSWNAVPSCACCAKRAAISWPLLASWASARQRSTAS